VGFASRGISPVGLAAGFGVLRAWATGTFGSCGEKKSSKRTGAGVSGSLAYSA
jgi:hypothetical protein